MRAAHCCILSMIELHVSIYLRSNIPQTALVAALDTYDFYSKIRYQNFDGKPEERTSEKGQGTTKE
jgi:hypothetical protein